jgi:hypothetical protein
VIHANSRLAAKCASDADGFTVDCESIFAADITLLMSKNDMPEQFTSRRQPSACDNQLLRGLVEREASHLAKRLDIGKVAVEIPADGLAAVHIDDNLRHLFKSAKELEGNGRVEQVGTESLICSGDELHSGAGDLWLALRVLSNSRLATVRTGAIEDKPPRSALVEGRELVVHLMYLHLVTDAEA